MSNQFVYKMYKMMFAVLCSVLVSSALLHESSAAQILTLTPEALFFARYDTNPMDGIISSAEFHKAAYTYDVNGDGNITRVEFTTLVRARMPVSEVEASQLFNDIDLNHDGTFDDKEISTHYNVIDENGDGQITLTEFQNGFIRIIMSQGGHHKKSDS